MFILWSSLNEVYDMDYIIENKDSYDSDPWRVFRIMAEFVEGFDELRKVIPAVSIFGSARMKETDAYYQKMLLLQAGAVVLWRPAIKELRLRTANLWD
jgi:hypothetical protein